MGMAPEAKPQVRAGCYCRISSDPKDKREGVDRQREDTAVMCEINGWTPVGYYVDNDRSSSNGKDARPEWDRLMADMRAGAVDAVVVWNQDRGWRKMADLEQLRPAFASLGVKLATTNIGTIDFNNPDDIFRVQVSTALSEMEVAKMRVRQLRAARQRAERGLPKWKRAFGYTDDRQPDPATAPLVKAAYEAVVKGEKITHIAERWNAAGVVGLNGQPWTPSTLSLFLRSPRNCGLRAHNDQIVVVDGKPVKGAWPPLVSEKLWRAAQAVLKKNVHGPKSVRKHLLTGVMQCGREGCDGTLAGNWVMQRDGGHVITYSCKRCRGVSVRQQDVEPIVMAALIKRLARADAVKLLRKKVYHPEEAEKLDAEEKVLLERAAEIAGERAKGLIDGVGYHQMKQIINADLADIERRRQDQERLRVLEDVPLGTDKVADAVIALPPDRLRKAIDLIMVVEIKPVGRGNKVFDRNRIAVEWK